MARRRSFIAEWQHQTRLAEQRQRREQAAAVRAHNQAVRDAERAEREARAARNRARRAAKARDLDAERAAKAAYRAQMEAQARARSAEYVATYDEIDNLLEATLDIDDYVDLSGLKIVAEHPTFEPTRIAPLLLRPKLIGTPPEPVFIPPPEPSGLRNLFGGRAKYEQEYHAAGQRWQDAHARWQRAVTVDIPAENARILAAHEAAEREREDKIARAYSEYQRECEQREADAAESNEVIDTLIKGLGSGEVDSIDEYIGIVLANSIYPDSFPVSHDFTFDGDLRELRLLVTVPSPVSIPTVKHVKYVASADEMRETPLAQKDQRARYNNAVYAVALRTLHEVFEADRANHIESISLEVGTETADPATGHDVVIKFVLAAASREKFLALNLAGVDKLAALLGISASVSKNPFALTPVVAGNRSVRR